MNKPNSTLKLLWPLVFCIPILFLELSVGTKTALIIGIFLWVEIQFVKDSLLKVARAADNEFAKVIKKAPTYRIEYSLDPNWDAILSLYAEEFKMDTSELEKEVRNVWNETKGEDTSYNEQFTWINYHDGVSGMDIIWRSQLNDKGFFVNAYDVYGQLLPFGNEFQSKYDNSYKGSSHMPIILSNDFIGFKKDNIERTIQSFPTQELTDYLVGRSKFDTKSIKEGNKLPTELMNVLEEYEVNYKSDIDEHHLLSKFGTLSISIKIFYPDSV